MVAATIRSRAALTGRARMRPGLFGILVLQVELQREYYQLPNVAVVRSSQLEWADAKWEDLQELPGFTIGRPTTSQETKA